jgi:hypothetical protein
VLELAQGVLDFAQDARGILGAKEQEQRQHHHDQLAATGCQECYDWVRHIDPPSTERRTGYRPARAKAKPPAKRFARASTTSGLATNPVEGGFLPLPPIAAGIARKKTKIGHLPIM